MKYFSIFILLFLFGCNSSNKEAFALTVVSKEGYNIKAGDSVYIKEQAVGKVSAVGLTNELDVYAKVIFNQPLLIPDDSRFLFTSHDFFRKCIEIFPGESKTFLNSGGKVYASVAQEIPLDTLINKFTDALENAKPVRNQDSIVRELNELNKQLEKLNSEL